VSGLTPTNMKKRKQNCDYLFKELKLLKEEKRVLILRLTEVDSNIDKIEEIKEKLVGNVFEDMSLEAIEKNQMLAEALKKELQ